MKAWKSVLDKKSDEDILGVALKLELKKKGSAQVTKVLRMET